MESDVEAAGGAKSAARVEIEAGDAGCTGGGVGVSGGDDTDAGGGVASVRLVGLAGIPVGVMEAEGVACCWAGVGGAVVRMAAAADWGAICSRTGSVCRRR